MPFMSIIYIHVDHVPSTPAKDKNVKNKGLGSHRYWQEYL